MDASPRNHVVPPFAEKPPAASRTLEGLEPNASDSVEHHPTSRCYKRWSCGFENPYGQKSEESNDWHIGHKRKQQKISAPPIVTP
jgi:hypothetical protein